MNVTMPLERALVDLADTWRVFLTGPDGGPSRVEDVLCLRPERLRHAIGRARLAQPGPADVEDVGSFRLRSEAELAEQIAFAADLVRQIDEMILEAIGGVLADGVAAANPA